MREGRERHDYRSGRHCRLYTGPVVTGIRGQIKDLTTNMGSGAERHRAAAASRTREEEWSGYIRVGANICDEIKLFNSVAPGTSGRHDEMPILAHGCWRGLASTRRNAHLELGWKDTRGGVARGSADGVSTSTPTATRHTRGVDEES